MKCQHMSLIYVTTTTNHPLFSISIPSHRSCPPLSAVLRPVTCRAATPPPHQTDPPPGNHSEHLQGFNFLYLFFHLYSTTLYSNLLWSLGLMGDNENRTHGYSPEFIGETQRDWFRVGILPHLYPKFKIVYRSSSPFFSGCRCSFGILPGMGGTDRTTDRDLEDKIAMMLMMMSICFIDFSHF
ncbi:hypothetical protein Lal_00021767 [Lupinus albus]|nr:hypothetical protein Lal_00021767 [Lupinus albus]